jgi:hypothetical protein
MLQRLSFILFYSILGLLLLVIFCNGGKSAAGKKEKKKLNPQIKDEGAIEGNANANQFLHSIHSHFEYFGTPFEPLEQEKVNNLNFDIILGLCLKEKFFLASNSDPFCI